MEKCPNCGNEYEGLCPNCNPGSTDDKEILQENPGEANSGPVDSGSVDSSEDAVLLTTVSDNFEASLLETRLKESGIPVMLKYRESGAYLSFYMGKTSFGVDIYVPARLLEDARLIIEAPPAAETGDEEIPEDESLDEAKKEYQERIEFRAWMIFAAIFLIIAAAVLISLVVK